VLAIVVRLSVGSCGAHDELAEIKRIGLILMKIE